MAETPQIRVQDRLPASVSESIRTLRSHLLLRLAGNHKCFAVTSARTGEGKSTISASLAASLTSPARKVLLVDGDLRAPVLHRLLDVDDDKGGLSALLSGRGSLRDLCGWIDDALAFLPSGPAHPDPQQLLVTGAFDRALKEARSLFDVVIIDTSGVLESMDATFIASRADGAIVVVGCGNATQEELRAVPRHLRAAGANVIGAVLNRVRGSQQPVRIGPGASRVAEPEAQASELGELGKAVSAGVPPK